MGNKYLNKNARFQCGNGNAVWFRPQSGDSVVKINRAEALLDNCSISLIGVSRPGQCNLIPDPSTGAPGPCMASMIGGSWNNNVRLRVGGKGVLSSGCSISCPVGGTIKPFRPTIVALSVNDEAKSIASNIALPSDICNENEASAAESLNDFYKDKDFENSILEEKEAERKQTNNEGDDIVQKVEFALCDYKNCSKAKECKYLRTNHTLKETNESKNAAELKINMGKDAFDLYAGDCSFIASSLYGSYMYSIAHHHLIPVNQCYKDFAEIVKLANFYNYNINKAENGISLPTMNVGYDKQPFEERKKISFNAMEKLGRQWHKGGHKYSCKIKAEIDRTLPKPFKNYKDAVDDLLRSFSIKLNDELKCRIDNYEQQALEFTRTMDHICEKVAKRLRRFEDSPRKADPYFVSKFAFYYAYQEKLSEHEESLFGKDE